MAFHPRYFSAGLRNSSDGYNYQEWNRSSRFHAAEQIGVDTRPQPKALEAVELQPDVRLLPAPGGVIVFSGAQLHSTVPNTSGRTRYSIDFRTVHLGDACALRGAVNVDSRCTGSTMDDYLRCTDGTPLPPQAKALYEAGPPQPAAKR
jgi:ectoine hydroxylase-related dioxygenase (phytanoyl-CoA dioxygenase family)